ncbi:hypothetical protein [uncultured Roseobacter sp.]|uniref:hypothetical protein n=1 Tax=uncultured Roseobacter sp. TaxID=114847 RepID=UPI00261B8113|nr:hypothetical protein [uncultured Roseobacter sp.]
MIAESISAVRSSGQTLNRFCFGFLALAGLYYVDMLPVRFFDNLGNEGPVSFQLIILYVLVFVLSLALGTIVMFLGCIGQGKRFSEKSFALRAKRVGDTQNALLAEFLRDANNKHQTASGIAGLLVFLTAALIVGILLNSWNHSEVFSEDVSASSGGWRSIAAIMVGTVLSHLMRASAAAGIVALDELLFEDESEGGEQK